MKWVLILILAVPAFGVSAAARTIVMSSGQQEIIPLLIEGQITVTNPASVKVAVQKGRLHLAARSPGRSEILIERPRRHYDVIVYSSRLRDAREAILHWLSRTYGLSLETLPDKLVLHGRVLRLEDWMDLQRLKREFHAVVSDARPSDEVRRDIRDSINQELSSRSLFAAKAALNGDSVSVSADPQDKTDKGTFKNLADRYGLDNPVNTNNVELRPMVEVEIVIAEVKRNALRSLGLKLPGSYSATVIPSGDLSSASTTFNPLNLEFDANEENNSGRVLANPKLLCRSGESAHFVAGGQIPIRLMAWRESQMEWKPYGVILDISPTADSTGAISTKLVTEISLIDEAHKVDGIPALLTNRIETQFDLRGSKTIALSGLIKSEIGRNSTGTPLLSSIPILGDLFKSKDYKNNRSELVVFVTPRVISPDNPPPPPALPDWRTDD